MGFNPNRERPRCQSYYLDPWAMLWRCEEGWGHLDSEGRVTHRAHLPWPPPPHHLARINDPVTWSSTMATTIPVPSDQLARNELYDGLDEVGAATPGASIALCTGAGVIIAEWNHVGVEPGGRQQTLQVDPSKLPAHTLPEVRALLDRVPVSVWVWPPRRSS